MGKKLVKFIEKFLSRISFYKTWQFKLQKIYHKRTPSDVQPIFFLDLNFPVHTSWPFLNISDTISECFWITICHYDNFQKCKTVECDVICLKGNTRLKKIRFKKCVFQYLRTTH